MRKLMVVVTGFLSFCAILLVLSAISIAQRWCSLKADPQKRGYFQVREGESVMRILGLRRQLILIVLLLFFSPLVAKNAFAFDDLISVNPTEGPPGSTVTVSGSDWPPGEQIDLSWSSLNPVASAKADENGKFTIISSRCQKMHR